MGTLFVEGSANNSCKVSPLRSCQNYKIIMKSLSKFECRHVFSSGSEHRDIHKSPSSVAGMTHQLRDIVECWTENPSMLLNMGFPRCIRISNLSNHKASNNSIHMAYLSKISSIDKFAPIVSLSIVVDVISKNMNHRTTHR